MEGLELVDKINALAKPPGSGDELPRKEVVIANCGELICDQAKQCKEITLPER